MTYSLATMAVSEATFREIHHKLKEAGYDHAILNGDEGLMLDMTHIGLEVDPLEDSMCGRVHVTVTDDEIVAELEVTNGTWLQPGMSPIPVYTHPAKQTIHDYTLREDVTKLEVTGSLTVEPPLIAETWGGTHGVRPKDPELTLDRKSFLAP